jgi:hypothetical protein
MAHEEVQVLAGMQLAHHDAVYFISKAKNRLALKHITAFQLIKNIQRGQNLFWQLLFWLFYSTWYREVRLYMAIQNFTADTHSVLLAFFLRIQ